MPVQIRGLAARRAGHAAPYFLSLFDLYTSSPSATHSVAPVNYIGFHAQWRSPWQAADQPYPRRLQIHHRRYISCGSCGCLFRSAHTASLSLSTAWQGTTLPLPWVLRSGLITQNSTPERFESSCANSTQSVEHTARIMTGRIRLIDNIAKLRDLVGLSNTDCRILEFAVSLHSERLLDEAADLLGSLNTVNLIHALAVLLETPEKDVRSAVSPQGLLARSGLLSIDGSSALQMRSKIDLLSSRFADTIAALDADPVLLLRGTVVPAPNPHLTLDDYSHISGSLDILRPYLRRALMDGRRGVNILVHGSPGTGKTQLGRVLAQELDCELFEVASEDSDGGPVAADGRLRAFRAAQSIFAQRRVLLLFDEVEDVFDDGDMLFGRKSTAQTRKAWVKPDTRGQSRTDSVAVQFHSAHGSGVHPPLRYGVRTFDTDPVSAPAHRAGCLRGLAASRCSRTDSSSRSADAGGGYSGGLGHPLRPDGPSVPPTAL